MSLSTPMHENGIQFSFLGLEITLAKIYYCINSAFSEGHKLPFNDFDLKDDLKILMKEQHVHVYTVSFSRIT